MTKEAYREELAAAHARIAQLEDQLAEAVATTDPKIKKLEEERAMIVRTSAPRYMRKSAAGIVGAMTLVFAIVGVIAWAAAGAHPNEAGLIAGIGGLGVVVGLLIALLQFVISPATAKQQLEKIDQDLAEARRIAKLESEVAQIRRVRVAPEPIAKADEPEADGDVIAAEPRARR